MEEQFYEDLISILNTKETLKPHEQKLNNKIIKLRESLKALFNTIKSEQSKNNIEFSDLKKSLIQNIKKQIEEINNSYFLRLGHIIKDEKINMEELAFALRIIYPTERTKDQLEKVHELKKIDLEVQKSQEDLENIKDLSEIIKKLINELQDKIKTNISPIHFIKRKNRKKEILEIKNRIEKLIEKIMSKTNRHYNNLQELKRKIDSNNLDEAETLLIKIVESLIKSSEDKKIKMENDKTRIKKKIGLTDKQIENITSTEAKSCIYILIHKTIKSNLTKGMIIILELINQIEQNDYTRLNITQIGTAITDIEKEKRR